MLCMVKQIINQVKVLLELKEKKKKYKHGVGIYDLNNNLIKNFDYAKDLASYLQISKVILSKYLNKGLVYKEMYYSKVNAFKV